MAKPLDELRNTSDQKETFYHAQIFFVKGVSENMCKIVGKKKNLNSSNIVSCCPMTRHDAFVILRHVAC